MNLLMRIDYCDMYAFWMAHIKHHLAFIPSGNSCVNLAGMCYSLQSKFADKECNQISYTCKYNLLIFQNHGRKHMGEEGCFT